MLLSTRTRFFNFFRSFFVFPWAGAWLSKFTQNKGYDHFLVKCIPQNYQFAPGSFRIARRDGIWFRLDLSEYMEWVIYFGLNVEKREGLYPLVKKGMVVVDAGSNIGETLLHFASLAGEDGKVYGFEPVPLNFNKCIHNIAMNVFKNISVHPLALSDKRETLYFGNAENLNSGGIFMQKELKKGPHSVQALTLDEFATENKIGRVDLIKIDVEGFELNVLKGAMNILKRDKPVLFVEVDDENLKRQGTSAQELHDLLQAIGYRIRKASADKKDKSGERPHYDIICE